MGDKEYSDLEEERGEIEVDMINIRYQIENAKDKAFDGDYSDTKWFRNANYALRMKGARHQTLLRKMSEISRKGKHEEKLAIARERATLAEEFITASRKHITKDQWDAVYAEAKAESERQQGELLCYQD